MNPAHHIELLLSCTQLITNYTRSTLSSMSSIGHISTSMPGLQAWSGVIPCSISDHDIIYPVFKHSNKSENQSRVITIRDFKTFDIMEYSQDLMDCNLYDSVNNCDNITDDWDTWSFKVNTVMNKHAPLKTHRVKSTSSPWITRDTIALSTGVIIFTKQLNRQKIMNY